MRYGMRDASTCQIQSQGEITCAESHEVYVLDPFGTQGTGTGSTPGRLEAVRAKAVGDNRTVYLSTKCNKTSRLPDMLPEAVHKQTRPDGRHEGTGRESNIDILRTTLDDPTSNSCIGQYNKVRPDT